MMTERQPEVLQQQMRGMDARGCLTAGVVHDFNNYLTIIGTASDLLARPDLCAAHRERHVAAISDTVKRASRLTSQLLGLAQAGSFNAETFAACGNVRSMLEMCRTIGGTGVTVIADLPETPCMIHADPCRFDTAIINMVINARDAMDAEGTLTLAVRLSHPPPTQGERESGELRMVAVSVADTGVGISADRLDSIFAPFFTTKGPGKGMGIGLSQVFGFAKQAGGNIVVDSTVGDGTTFTIYLPLARQSDGSDLASD